MKVRTDIQRCADRLSLIVRAEGVMRAVIGSLEGSEPPTQEDIVREISVKTAIKLLGEMADKLEAEFELDHREFDERIARLRSPL